MTKEPTIPHRRRKAKGRRAENIVVELMQLAGFAAERMPLSGSLGGKYAGDVSMPFLGIDRKIEVKCRANGFAQLYGWLANNYSLVVKRDRSEPLVVMRLSDALAVAMQAEKAKQ